MDNIPNNNLNQNIGNDKNSNQVQNQYQNGYINYQQQIQHQYSNGNMNNQGQVPNQYQNVNINNQGQIPNQNQNYDMNYQNQEYQNPKSKKAGTIAAIIIGSVVLTLVSIAIAIIIIQEETTISKKPIIYLYPEEQTEITVKLGKPENVTCSYPKYDDGWTVTANPDGTLIDKDTNRKLYSLYWEGDYTTPIPMDEGFVVKGEDSSKFLEEKLAILGLNEREAEEFIVYWLPVLEKNEYNYIRFASVEEINESMPLEFSTQPDTVIRVLMQFKEVDKDYKVKEQVLETPERKGFVVVEWGGTEIK